MPQHKHVTVELLRFPSTAFTSELDVCNGRGTTLRRADPTGTAVAVIEHSLTGKHMLETNALVPSLPRESDATTLALAEVAAARGGHGKKGQAIMRDRAVAFTAYPDLDGYVDHMAGSVPTWCLLLANSHSEFDMAVHVRLMAAGLAWDHEYVPYDRPVIVRTDSYVVIKLVETQVLPDPMRMVVEWFHVRSTFALGGSSHNTLVTMQIDPLPYVLFDIALQPSARRVTDPEVLRVAQHEMRMALDLALEEFELGQLLIPSSMNVYDKITLAQMHSSPFKSCEITSDPSP
ncbi:hypothetical protein BCR44DRAFT_1255274 [Catenaria anguillulae PL171]|uniref:Uncharacterized protein n=1 Tax=Catenaria anguillulae PL171 TaxID=765915 RepID=A0A1Y2HEI3_9FUNG|nr:hypothetical protein BCR44DRAFT_1255274 [Catenaria anguillulae PL171]